MVINISVTIGVAINVTIGVAIVVTTGIKPRSLSPVHLFQLYLKNPPAAVVIRIRVVAVT